MTLIKKDQAKETKFSESCVFWEYFAPTEAMSFEIMLINGRYPDSGNVQNQECEEMYYVISGSGVVHSEGQNYPIKPGDLYLANKKQKHWMEGKNLLLAIVSAPKFTEEQYKIVD